MEPILDDTEGATVVVLVCEGGVTTDGFWLAAGVLAGVVVAGVGDSGALGVEVAGERLAVVGGIATGLLAFVLVFVGSEAGGGVVTLG